jgi:hypothetical protein
MVSRLTLTPNAAPAAATNTAASAVTVPPRLKLLPLKADIRLPPKLNHPPTTADLIINKTFDGLTPKAAAKQITSHLTGKVAAENKNLVDTTVNARVRDMQVALNNVFTKGTPNRQFLESKQPAEITVLGSLSASNAIVYQVTSPGQEPKYFTKGWGGGGFTEMAKPPVQVVMEARLNLDPPGLRMTYPTWQNKALAGPLTTITEG